MSNGIRDSDDILLQAVEIESAERRNAFLDEACGEDTALRQQLANLVADHFAAGDFLEQPVIPQLAMAAGDIDVDSEIGHYKLVDKIGEGGMGIVYMAEQQAPVRRKVALKLIKPGMDTREIIARFESERQTLALMDHPGVAKVLDGGATESGRPYFVMELVRGVPITDFCDQVKLSSRDRLRLFVEVCQAVQHAHQKGIIHRDLKPSNILVTIHDDTPVVKVIDFGVSKALSQQLTEKTLFTAYGQMVGTPLYMSPEQSQMSGLDVDTRSDVYSLGILLYELLTGTTPFEQESLKKAGVDEWRRIIREDEPPRPSARVSTLQAETLVTVCDRRGADPRRLSQSLRGELDWIVMKALEKSRSRRYESASSLARDIDRYLSEEPIEARPPSAAYRFRKFAQRNKVAMLSVGLVAATLLLGVTVSTWQAIRADAQRVRAEAAEQAATAERDRAVQAERAERLQRQRAEQQTEKNRQLLYVADMNMAHQAWEAGDVAGMTRLLERYQIQPGEEDLPGFQWRHLWYLLQRSRNTPILDHGTRITSIDFSPDGKMLATIGYGDFLKLWDVQSQQLIENIPGPWYVASTAFSPGGKFLAYQCPGAFLLRDLATGSEHRRLECRSGTLSAAFAPDGTKLAAAGFGEVVYLWDLESDDVLKPLRGHEFVIWKVAFSPDGRTLASAGFFEVILWDVESGDKRHVIPTNPTAAQCVAFAPDGKILATGGRAGVLRFWNVQTGGLLESIDGKVPGGIGALAYSPDGRLLAAGSWDGTVVLLDVSTNTVVDVLKGHQQAVFVLRFSNDNKTLASASFDGTVRLWDVGVRRPAHLLEGHEEAVTSVALSEDNSVVVSGSADGTIRLWDVQSGEELATHNLHESAIEAVGISGDGKTLASVSWGGKVVITDLAAGKSTEFSAGMPNSLAFFPDNKTLVVGGGGVNLTLWDTVALAPRSLEPGHEHMIRAVAISPDGKYLATGGWDTTIKVRNVETDDAPQPLKQHRGSVECLAFSPDGRTLASGAADNTVILWDLDSFHVRETLVGHTGPVNSLSFSPDSSILASASHDRTIRLWYLDGTKQPEILPEFAPVTSVAFSSDAGTLVSASGNYVRIWRTGSDDRSSEVARFAELAHRSRTIATAHPQERQKIIEDVVSHLAVTLEPSLLLRDVMLATSTARRLEEHDERALAREALRMFGKVIVSSADARFAAWADAWEAQD